MLKKWVYHIPYTRRIKIGLCQLSAVSAKKERVFPSFFIINQNGVRSGVCNGNQPKFRFQIKIDFGKNKNIFYFVIYGVKKNDGF